MSKRNNSMSASEKLKIVLAFESGKSKDQIQSEFGVAPTTYYKIIKSKELIKSQCSEGHGYMKRSRPSTFPDVEKSLSEWIQQNLDSNIPISGPLLKEKAKEFASQFGIQNFSASNGWLEGFKKRNDIAFRKGARESKSGKSVDQRECKSADQRESESLDQRESKSLDQRVCDQWIEDMPSLLTGYDPNNIYNAHETALFFKCLPDKTFTYKGQKCHQGKHSKERLTILQCVNMSGSDKLPLLIIGKSRQPRCFKGVKTLPVDYASNTKAWMTKGLFADWLIKVDRQMKTKQRKIVLFIDNSTAHMDLPILANVKVILYTSTTSKLQPLNQGIIHRFKQIYRTEVIRHMLNSLEVNISFEINLLLALRFARRAWHTVSDKTIKYCFKKAGFSIGPAEQDFLMGQYEVELKIGPSVNEWAKLIYHYSVHNISIPTFEDFVQVDDDVTTTGEYTDEAIKQNDSDDEDPLDITWSTSNQSYYLDSEGEDRPTKQDALKALETLNKFWEFSMVDPIVFDKLYELEKYVDKV